MYDLSMFEITEDKEVICGGAVYSEKDFRWLLSKWLENAINRPGEYGITEPED